MRDFGSGDLAGLFTGIGPNRELIGREAASLARAAGGPEAQAAIAQAGLFARVRRASGVVPTQVAGDLPGGAAARRPRARAGA